MQGYLEMSAGRDSITQAVLGFALLLGRVSTPTIQACAIGTSVQVQLEDKIRDGKKREIIKSQKRKAVTAEDSH